MRRETHRWMETKPFPSSQIKVLMALHQASYSWLGLSTLRPLPGRYLGPMTETAVADTGVQMDICSMKLATWLGISSWCRPRC